MAAALATARPLQQAPSGRQHGASQARPAPASPAPTPAPGRGSAAARTGSLVLRPRRTHARLPHRAGRRAAGLRLEGGRPQPRGAGAARRLRDRLADRRLFAVAKTPKGLAAELGQALSQFVNSPLVTVTLGESSTLRFYVVGEVNKPGEFPLDRPHHGDAGARARRRLPASTPRPRSSRSCARSWASPADAPRRARSCCRSTTRRSPRARTCTRTSSSSPAT